MSRRRWLPLTVALGLAGCGAVHGRHVAPLANRDGTLAGVIRSADTGAAIDDALVVLRRPDQLALRLEPTDGAGAYSIAAVTPGRYQVTVYRQHRAVNDDQVTILAGQITGLDLAIAPRSAPATTTHAPVGGARAATEIDVASGGPLWRYRPAHADPLTGAVEGTVTEQGERTRLGGAVITVADHTGQLVSDAVSDDSGRFHCDSLPPGAYVVSAYYTLLGRGQFEIRRSDVVIAGGDVVVVPLAIETQGG